MFSKSCFFIVIVLSLLGVSVSAEVFTDDFSEGIDYATWKIVCSDPDYYTIDDTQGDVRINKIQGGTLPSQSCYLSNRFNIRGDFDLRIDFRDANINRISGDENQIILHAVPDEWFAIVRSDSSWAGNNIHFFHNGWIGTQSCTDTAGTLRITRTGTTITGYLNDNPIASRTGPDVDAWISFTLQQWQSNDPMSVTYDNFYVEADQIIWAADFNEDSGVNLIDLATFVSAWLSKPGDGNWNEKCNINFPSDNVINILDFNIFAGQWLRGTE